MGGRFRPPVGESRRSVCPGNEKLESGAPISIAQEIVEGPTEHLTSFRPSGLRTQPKGQGDGLIKRGPLAVLIVIPVIRWQSRQVVSASLENRTGTMIIRGVRWTLAPDMALTNGSVIGSRGACKSLQREIDFSASKGAERASLMRFTVRQP